MPQLNDLSRSLVALDQDSTIIAVVELSQSSWLVGGVLPGIERQPQKKLEPSAERLLGLLHRCAADRVGQIGAEQESDQRSECLNRDVKSGAGGGQMAHRAQIGRHPEVDGPNAALSAHDHQRHFYRQPQIRPAKRRQQMRDPEPRAAVAPLLERFRLRNAAADPQHKQGGQNADREQRPPRDRFGQNAVQAGVDERR